MKKFFSLVLALVMALSLATVAWGVSSAAALQTAIDNAQPGETITLTGNITDASEIITIDKPITLDGGNFTLTSTAGRAINVDTTGEVTIKNLTIAAGGERAINVINKAVTLKVTNVTATADNYAVMVATSAGAANVTISGSNLTGMNVINVAGPGAQVTVTGSTINCNGGSDVEGYAALCLHNTADGAKITATGCTIDVAVPEYSKVAVNSAPNAEILINGSANSVENHAAYIKFGNNTSYSFASVAEAVEYAVDEMGADENNEVEIIVTEYAVNNGESFTPAAGVKVTPPVGTELVDDGTGNFVVVEEAANTSSASGLYAKATSKGATLQKNITLNFFKAVDNKVDKKTSEYVADGNVAYYMIDGVLTKYAEVYTLADADMVIYTDEACKNVYAYLDIVDPFYVGDGAVTKNFGTACGQYSNDEDDGFDDEATYYVVFDQLCVGVEVGQPYDAQILVNGKLVAVNASDIPMNLHKAIYTRNDKGVITSIKCSVCGVAAVKAANYAVLPEKAVMVDENVAPLWYWASAAAVTPSTDKVTSAATFDAGIAMYVGMSVLAATGSAVVLKKKD